MNKKEYDKQYRLKNIEIIRAKDREYKKIQRKKYPEKVKEIKKKSYHKHKEKNLECAKLYRSKNLEKIKLYQINYRTINREKLKQKTLEYRIKHRKIIRVRQYKYVAIKRKTDPYFKLMDNLRSRIYCVLKGKIKKSTRTLNLLGVENISEVKLHLESQFKNGMTWSNHGEWHIDHIKPCASFNLICPVQQLACFHYKNLQPLWALENMRKSSKLIDIEE
tara:strand:+ start:183 stop:842 length:660 start_codon:yes stop_codon:yes gene_type:complete